MSDDKQRAEANGQTGVSARAIVIVGVSSLFLVLLGTITLGIGPAYLVGMILLFVTLLFGIVVLYRRTRSGLW